MLPVVIEGHMCSWDLHPIRTEEQFDRVLEIVKAEFEAEIEDSMQGPGAKIARVIVAGHPMTLRFSSVSGVTLESADLGSSETMEQIRRHFEDLLA